MVAEKKLSIVHINTHDKAGGAAKVAWRLMENQRAEGHDANMLVGAKMSTSPYSYTFPLEIDQSTQAYCRQTGQLFYEYQGSHKLINHPLVRNADVLHLHNLHGGYFNPFSISALSHLKPVVWTLHDMQSITGHCAHSFDCEKWMITCGECPYLTTEPALHIDTTTQLFQDKKRIYEHSYLWVVTPSKWLKNKVERSILRNQPVELIYNGIDTNIFRPYNKKEARKKFHIPEDVLVIGAVGHGGTLENQWKGGKYTQAALEIFMARFPDCIFVNIGANSETRNPRILNVPHISSESELAQAYSTLDIFLYTSIADNCPLVVLEALSCGVPIVTFDTGGIPELVRDGMEGQVSQYKNEQEIVKSLEKLAADAGLRDQYSRNAREIAIAKFDHRIVFEQYEKLYERCLKEHKIRSKEVKYFPISKVPKIIVTKSFIEAENAKAVSQSRDLPSLDTLNREAELKIQRRDCSGAKSILLNVIERCPYNLNALNNLAIIEIAEKNWESAAEILKKNLEIDATNETTLKNLKYLENRLILHKSVFAAENLINQKEYSEGRAILEKVVEVDNKHIDALNNLAVIGIHEKNFESARLLLEKVLSIDSKNGIANKQLGYIRQYQADNPSAKIDVSIVISTKDRAKLLDGMLTSLAKATFGVNYEVIVIEGNSSDNTLEILHKHGIKQVYNETVCLGNERHSWPQLYNFGFSKAKGIWGMYASDDITFSEKCISKAVELLNKQNSDVAGGIFFYKNIIAESGWDKFGIDYTYGQKLLMNYGLLRLEDFRDVNGLDEDYKFYCADGDLCFKLYEKGKKLIPLPQCLVVHNNVLDNQKKSNLNDSKQDIELYLRKWMHFVSTNKTPEPRRLFLEMSLRNALDIKSTLISTKPSQTMHVKKLQPDINTLDPLRMAGVWIDGQPLRLHLGCGERHLSGYINIDYPPIEHTVQTKSASDVFADITTLQFPDQTVDEIRLHHVFEHFDRPTALALLCRWNLWLKTGGSILIETPDFEASIALIDSQQHSYKQKQGILRHLFGSHEAEWAVHKDGWYKDKFQHVLSSFGFDNIQFEFTEWQMTRNITVLAKKHRIINLSELQQVVKRLLRDSMVDESASEEKLLEVLRNKFEKFLDKTNSNRTPIISIFIPVYNSEKYLAETLDSILAQTFHDFEIIIADDGSTDTSLEIARAYENRDKRISVLSLPHNGEVVARNEAIKRANPTSKYLLNHDSDDISLPTKLKKLVEYLETHPAVAIVGCFAEYFDDKGNCKGQPHIEWQPERIRDTFANVNSMINSAALVRREVFHNIGCYREEFRSVDDYDFFARALIAGFELANIPEVLHRIRLHPTSVGSTRSKTQQTLAEKIRENYKQQNGKRQRTVQLDEPAGNNLNAKTMGQQLGNSLVILHTVEFYYPHLGGAETVVQQISERLAKRGHRVTVATTRLDNRTFREINGVNIEEFFIKGSMGNGIFGDDIERYKAFLRNHPADVMMNYAVQQWATDLAFEALPMRKNKVNVLAPCGYSALSNSRTLRWPQFADYFNRIIPLVIPQYDAAIYHSSLYQDYEYAQNHGFTNGIVIPNGVDEEEFIQIPSVNFREKYNIKTSFLGLCVANYYRDKGQDRVIECVRQMNRDDFTIVFIGKEGDQLASLKAQAGNLSIQFCVDIPREDTLAAYHEADIFLFGSYIEASPLVIIEAKASKTPFVSTDCGNVREWKGGIVCNPNEMAMNANRILDNENLRKQLAEEGWREWKEKLTWESVVDKYEDLYSRLSSEKRKGSSRSVQTQHLQSCANSNQLQDNGSKIMMSDGLSDLFKKAEDAFLEGAYDEAISNYKKIIEIDSASFEAYENLAIAYTKVNQIDNAISTLEKSICLCADDFSVYNNLGVLYFKKSMYLDAKTYFEIALLLNPDYKEARQNLGKVEESIRETSNTIKTNLTLGLIFSKDRAMQLDAALRSFYMHCSDVHLLDLKVIYKTSNAVHEKQYEDLKKDYVSVLFIKEDGFKEQVLSVIRKYTYILFLVDDNIFLRNFSISELTNNLNENKNAIGFSLRLGANTVYCYALHSSQTPPNFTKVTSDILKYDWTFAERDFGYPLEVSSSLYRVKEIYPLLVQIHFRNPNTLEGQLAANKHVYVKTRPNLLCGKLSLTFCDPLNMVQDVCDNRAGSEDCYTSNTLSKKFGEGYRINIENYINFTPNACHQEVPLDFIKSKQ